MSKVYKAMYKCRLCGEVFEDGSMTGSEKVTRDVCIDFSMGKHIAVHGNPITDKGTHVCNDGSIGLADFIGFKAVEE